jgi:hypothetical protein
VPAGSLAPESSEKSLTNVIFEFISNTIRARSGYRLVSYGSIALIVVLSVGIFNNNVTYYIKSTTSTSNDYLASAPSEDRIRGARVTEVELSMEIIGKRKNADGSVSVVTIEDGSVLQTEDEFRVRFKTKKDAYVYIVIHDGLNKAKLLFPDPPKITFSNEVKANSIHTVPATWFWLDENVGIETVYVLASENQLDNIKSLLPEMENVEEPENKLMKFAKDNDAVVKFISFRHIDNTEE